MLPRKKRLVRLLDGATRSLDWDAALPEGAVVVGVTIPAFLKDAEAASFIDGIPAAHDDDGAQVAAAALAAHEQMKTRIASAWKNSPAHQDAPSPGQSAPQAEAPAKDAAEAHARMRDRISNAWKQGRSEQPRPPTSRNLWV